MDNPLSAQLQDLRDDPDVESRRAEIKRFAYDAAKKLQEYSLPVLRNRLGQYPIA